MSSQFESLPPELILAIIKHLNAKDRAHLFAVSNRFYEIKNEYYNQKVRIVIRNSFGNSLHSRLLNNCVRLCAQQSTGLRNDLDGSEIVEFTDVHLNGEDFRQRADLCPLYFNATQLILSQFSIASFDMMTAFLDLLGYLVRVLPKLKMLKLIFYQNRYAAFYNDIFTLLQNPANLRHLTIFNRCSINASVTLMLSNSDNSYVHDRSYFPVPLHLNELYFGGFYGLGFVDLIQALSKRSTHITRFGFYNDRIETCLKHLDLVESALASQISHLTLHSFANDYANVDELRSTVQLELMSKRFCALKVVYPDGAKRLFETIGNKEANNNYNNNS